MTSNTEPAISVAGPDVSRTGEVPVDEKGASRRLTTDGGEIEPAQSLDTTHILKGPNGEEYPTKDELATLRRVKGSISWLIYTIAFCELCERFAYYGTTTVCKRQPRMRPVQGYRETPLLTSMNR